MYCSEKHWRRENLCIRRLDGEWFIKEALEKVLFDVMTKHNGNAVLVELRPSRTADHLENVGDGVVNVAVLFAIEKLGPYRKQ